ncbi:PIP5K59B isoform E [Danaus plexippus plexippus]|uniref:PIP5K59B isoform E n=1 Tax=Danaus plexippus plexippus TaxID=278856 RepID=A0A212EGU8_DANPL|nr:PIP5K59B isoform E [Danaus plexippus plexippus]
MGKTVFKKIPSLDLPEIKGNHRKFRTLVTSYIVPRKLLIKKKKKHSPSKRKSIAKPSRAQEEIDNTGGIIGRPIKDYNPEYLKSRLSPRSSMRSSLSDFTDTTISTWNQRHQIPTEYPSVLSDRLKASDRLPFPRRIDFDSSREPGTSYADNVYRSSIQDRMESLSDQLTKVLSTGAGSSHINGSLADSGIQTDNTSTSVPQIYIEAHTFTPAVKILKDAAVDTRNEENLQDIPFIDEDEHKWRRRNLEKHKSMSNIPEKIDEVSLEHSSERLSSSLNRAKSPTFVEKFKKFFMDIGLVKTESIPEGVHADNTANMASTLPKNLTSYRAKSATPNVNEARETSTLPKDMRFRKVTSAQTVYIKPDSPSPVMKLVKDAEVQMSDDKKEHVSVVKLNGDEHIKDSDSERFIKEVVYVKSLEKAEIYSGRDSGSTIIVVPPAD